MIKTEMMQNGTLIRHFSDTGKMLLQVETGAVYSEAVDVVPCRYTYEETGKAAEQPVSGDEFLSMLEGVL